MMIDVSEFIHSLPRNEQVIVKHLRMLIMDTDPKIKEHISYGVPYFSRKRRICFLWPQSAPYGPKDALVSLGFCYGHMLSNEQGILQHEGRTQVCIVRYSSLDEINDKVIEEILFEALLVDDLPFKELKK